MKGYQYTYDDIVKTLKGLGISKGDSVFIHSNLTFFGMLDEANSAEEINEAFYRAFCEVIGDEGTIIVPTFSYSFCKNEKYDLLNSKSDCGMFTEYIRKLDGAMRSYDANFSVAAIGNLANEYTENAATHSFGKDSFWERFKGKKGKIVCMNFHKGSTFIHFIEKSLNVPYRYDKNFYGDIILNDKIIENQMFTHFVRALDKPEDFPTCDRMNEVCRATNKLKEAQLGRGDIIVYDASELFCTMQEILKVRPRFFLKVE
jgi:aminoglycoside 3-N-acetyltransferase